MRRPRRVRRPRLTLTRPPRADPTETKILGWEAAAAAALLHPLSMHRYYSRVGCARKTGCGSRRNTLLLSSQVENRRPDRGHLEETRVSRDATAPCPCPFWSSDLLRAVIRHGNTLLRRGMDRRDDGGSGVNLRKAADDIRTRVKTSRTRFLFPYHGRGRGHVHDDSYYSREDDACPAHVPSRRNPCPAISVLFRVHARTSRDPDLCNPSPRHDPGT
jgi:hypothetical protein